MFDYFKMGNQFSRVINFEEMACEDEGSKKLVHSEELKASSEKTNVNGPGTSFIDSTVLKICSLCRKLVVSLDQKHVWIYFKFDYIFLYITYCRWQCLWYCW